jgi:primosomal protein N''
VLFGSTDKVTGIYLWEKTQNLAWVLHHDSSRVDDALRACEFLAKKLLQQWIIHLIHLT